MRPTHFLIILFLFNLIASRLSAQVRFDRVDSIPLVANGQTLQNAWAGGINFPLYSAVDLNGDGTKDMILYDRVNSRLSCYLNDGSSSFQAWQYAPEYVSCFPYINRWVLMYDYNCDGKEDLFTISPIYPSCIACYRNDYTPGTGLRFTLVAPVIYETLSTTTFPVFASGVLIPAFEDIDGDGDMDILGYNSIPDGRVIYHKNESMEQFGHCDSLKFTYSSGCWGSFAFLVGGANSVGCFNCPCRINPYAITEDAPTPVFDRGEAKKDDTITSIFAIDIDGDQDKDLLVGDISATTTLMVRNGGTPTAALMDTQDVNFPSGNVPADFNGFHTHAYLDLDNDGLKDLIISPDEVENVNAQWVYKNTGTAAAPDFQLQTTQFLQDQMLDVGENAAPVVTDINGDGLNDIVVAGAVYDTAAGTYVTSLFYLRNVGTASSPSFQLVDDDLGGISSFAYNSVIYPAFGDLDGDGDNDLLLGTDDGKLQFFQRNGANYQLTMPNYMGIDVGNTCTPQLVDINRDGTLDIIAGEKNGLVNYFKNTGTATAASFSATPSEDTLGGIRLQTPGFTDGYTVPFAYDSAGTYRLAVSNMAGQVYFYRNIDGNLAGTFTLIDSLYKSGPQTSRIRFNVSVGGGDLNNDGFCDLIIGESAGGIDIWYQHDGIANVSAPEAVLAFSAYPNPGDRYLVIRTQLPGNQDASLELFEISGRLLRRVMMDGAETYLLTDKLAEGTYVLKLSAAGRSVSRRVSIVH